MIKAEKKEKSMKKNKLIPRFKNEDEEREFWAKNDFSDFIDQFEEANLDLSDLKPSTRTVTFRLPEGLYQALKILANKKDVPYQSLMKIFLAERIRQEMAEVK